MSNASFLLYNVNESIKVFIERIEEFAEANGGELDEKLDLQLADLELEKRFLCLELAKDIKNTISMQEACTLEYKRLQEKSKGYESAIEMKKKILAIAADGEKISDGVTSISYHTSKATIIDDESLIDAKYIKTKTEKSVDKGQIKNDIDSGLEVIGAHVEERKTITIK